MAKTPNRSNLKARRTVTAGQGTNEERLSKKEISRLAALSGLMAVYMYGSNAVDIFDEEKDSITANAKGMKGKAGKGLFATLDDISKSIKNLDFTIKNLGQHDPNIDNITRAFTTKNESNNIWDKFDAIINKLDTLELKLAIEINGSTDLSKLVEALYLFKNEDISGENGVLEKLDQIINGIQNSVKKSLSIDVSKALSNITNLQELVKAVQGIIMTIKSDNLTEDVAVQFGKQFNESIKTFIEIINTGSNIEEQHMKVFENIERMISSINSLSVPDINRVKEFNEFLGDNTKLSNDAQTLSTLLSRVSKLVNDDSLRSTDPKKIDGLANILEALANVSKIEKPNVASIKILNELVDENGVITQIISNVNKNLTTKVSQDAQNNLKYVSSLFATVSNLTQISLMDRIRMKLSISFIKHFIVHDVMSIIDTIQESSKDIKKEENKGLFDTFRSFIDSIIKIIEFNSASKLKMVSSLWWIKHFITKMTLDIINELDKNAKDISDSKVKENIETLTCFIQGLPAIANFGLKKLIHYSWKIELLKSFMRDSVQELINTINGLHGTNQSEIILSNVKNIIETLNDALDRLSPLKKIVSMSIKTGLISSAIIPQISDTIKKLSTLTALYSKIDSKSLDDTIDTIDKTVDALLDIKFKDLANLANDLKKVKGVLKDAEPIINYAKKLSTLGQIQRLVDAGAKATNNVIDTLITGINKFNDVDEKNIRNAQHVVDTFMSLIIKSASILLFGALVMTIIDLGALTGFTLALTGFIIGVGFALKLASKVVNDSSEAINAFTNLIIKSAFVLILGALISTTIKPEHVGVFGGLLLAFVTASIIPYLLFTVVSEKTLEGVKDFTLLIVASGAVLALGSLITSFVSVGDIATFGITLFLFVTASIIPYLLFTVVSEKTLEGVKDFTLLIVASGAVLMLGSLITKLVGFENVAAFGVTLGLFVWGTMYIYKWAAKESKNALLGLTEFTTLIIMSASVMALGSLFVKLIGIEPVAVFTGLLAGFIFVVVGAYTIASHFMRSALVGAAELGVLVLLSSLALTIGALVLKEIGWEPIVGFGIILLGFVGALSFIYTLFRKNITLAIPTAAALGVVALLSSFALSIGVLFMDKYPDGAEKIWTFVLADLVLVGGLSLIAYLLAKSKQNLILGVGLLGTIVVISLLSAVAIGHIAKIGSKYNLKNTWIVMGQIGVIIGGLSAMAIGLAAIAASGIGGAALAIGAAVLGGIVTIALLAGKAMKAIAESMIAMKAVKNFDPKPILNAIKNFIQISEALGPISKNSLKIMRASLAISSLNMVISSIARSIKDYASLRIPEYTGTKITGYRELKPEDFANAAYNVKIIIETLGGAVMAAYDAHPDMFETNLFGNSKFGKVSRALGNLGPLLSKIAGSVKDYASLRIPEYNGTKIVKYRELKTEDFTNASANVQLIISTLGEAVIASHDAHPDMFETNLFGNSKFGKVSRALGNLAPLLSKIAGSVADYASLKVPDFTKGFDKDGKPRGYIELDKTHFEKASQHVQEIINTLGGAIIKVYEKHPEYYETSGGIFGFGASSPFTKTIDANIKLADLISKISLSVRDFAASKVPTKFDKNGNAIDFESLNETHFGKAAAFINCIMTTLGEAVIKSAANMEKIGGAKDFKKAIEAQSKLGDLISNISTGVLNFASGKVPIGYDKDGKATGYKSLDKTVFLEASNRIEDIINNLGQAIISAYQQNGEYFDDGEDSDFAMACKAIGSMGTMISDVANGIQAYANMKIPEYDKDGQITGYRPIKPTDFTEAATTINQIINTIGSTIMATYDQHPEWFDDGPDSAMNVAATAIGSMGSMISSISEGIVSYAQLSIPDEFDSTGKPISFIKMKNTDFTDAGNTIAMVITTIAEAIGKAADNPVFGETSVSILGLVKASSGNKVANMLDALQKSSGILSGLSSTVQNYAGLRYATKWDKNGKPIEWASLNSTAFARAEAYINRTIVCIADGIVRAVQGREDIFGQNIQKSPAYTAAIAISKMGEALNVIAKSIRYYAKSEFPMTTWNNGKATTTITKLNGKDFEKAKKVIENVILCLAETIYKIYKERSELFDLNTASAATKINNSVTKISEIVKNISKQVEEISKVEFDKFNEAIKGKTGSFKESIELLADIFKAIQYGTGDGENESKITSLNMMSENPLFALQNDEKLKSLFDNIPNAIEPIKTVVGAVMSTVTSLDNSFVESTKFNETAFAGYVGTIKTVYDKLIELQEHISKDDKSSGNKMILFGTDKNIQLIHSILSINGSVSMVMNALKNWSKDENLSANSTDLGTKITNILGIYEKIVEKINSINSTINENTDQSLSGWFKEKIGIGNTNTALENFSALNASISDLINIGISSAEAGTIGYHSIGLGIDRIQESINNIKGIQTFSQHREVLDKYVSTINRLNLNKINSMTNFVNSMNQLAKRMGNLDRLTIAISKNLTGVLEKLTVRMEDAKKVIMKSEDMQDRRQKRLEKTISSIKDIMNQKLTINITQVDDTNQEIDNQTPTSSTSQSGTNTDTSNSTMSDYSGGGAGTSSTPNSSSQSSTTNSSPQNGGQSNNSNSSINRALTDMSSGIGQILTILRKDSGNTPWLRGK